MIKRFEREYGYRLVGRSFDFGSHQARAFAQDDGVWVGASGGMQEALRGRVEQATADSCAALRNGKQ